MAKEAIINSQAHRDNRDERKSLILQAGMKTLREKGISNASMNDIIRESGLSKGGVYHYFSSKDQLLIELWNYFFELYAFSNISRLNSDPEIKNQTAMEQIYTLIQYHESVIDSMGNDLGLMMDLYIEAIHNKNLREVFNQQHQMVSSIVNSLVKTAQDQGDIKTDINSDILSSALLAIFDGFGLVNQLIDSEEDIPRKALEAARILLDGAKTEKALKER